MGVFENLPYTNYQDLNIGWVLSVLKKMETAMDTQFQDAINKWIDENYNSLFFDATYDPVTETIIFAKGDK